MTITLTTFVPGTKAKADEVNANFTALQNAINEKAVKAGDSNQTFSVADATSDAHAVNNAQLKDLSNNLTSEINKKGTNFCVKSGNTTNGVGHLFSYSVLEITPLIAGTYDNLVILDYAGTKTIISTTPDNLDLTGCSDGDYNIFINPNGELYILNNTIYKQANRPTMIVNDIWLDTSVEPFNCIKYNGNKDLEFLDVPLGKVTIKDSAITMLETFTFNQNGYNINISSFTQSLASNGWTKLPNGLILQWGTTTIGDAMSKVSVTFPIKFPNSVFFIIPSKIYSDGYAVGYLNLTNSSVDFKNTSGSSNSGAILWMAMGI